MRRLALIATAGILLVGCGGDDSTSTTSPEQPAGTSKTRPQAQTTTAPKSGRAKFTGQARDTYDLAKTACGAFSASKVARDLGLPASGARTSEGLGRIAERFARGYSGAQRQAAFEGCLTALPNPTH